MFYVFMVSLSMFVFVCMCVCMSVCTSHVFYPFYFLFVFLFICIFSKERQKEGTDLDGWVSGMVLRGDERGKTMIRI